MKNEELWQVDPAFPVPLHGKKHIGVFGTPLVYRIFSLCAVVPKLKEPYWGIPVFIVEESSTKTHVLMGDHQVSILELRMEFVTDLFELLIRFNIQPVAAINVFGIEFGLRQSVPETVRQEDVCI